MALIFPVTPVLNQIFTYASKTWKWNGIAWTKLAPTMADMTLLSDQLVVANNQIVVLTNITTTQSAQIAALAAQLSGITSTKPANISIPIISGTASYGSTLTTTTGNWTNSPTGFLYVWNRKSTAGAVSTISGATSSSYTISSADAGMTLNVEVTAINSNGNSIPAAAAYTSAVTQGPSSTSLPVVSGILAVGQTLQVSTGAWTGTPTFAYQWLRNKTPIAGATLSNFVTSSCVAD